MENQQITKTGDLYVIQNIKPSGDDYVMPLGKYKGKTLKQVWEENPKYINWVIANTTLDNIKQEIYKTSFYLK